MYYCHVSIRNVTGVFAKRLALCTCPMGLTPGWASLRQSRFAPGESFAGCDGGLSFGVDTEDTSDCCC
jgi:hypothetical protein